jgi:effector-binding domain-containing protein
MFGENGMPLAVDVAEVSPRRQAVVRQQTDFHALPELVPALMGEVWQVLREAPASQPGHNVAVYLPEASMVEAGAEVSGPFQPGGRVVPSATSGGRVAIAEHQGPYAELGEAHEQIRRWCARTGHQLLGPHWEIYSHWDADPLKQWTRVYYLIGDEPERQRSG